jgi:eukaryotic-like serine/threonine-protein kinase
VLSIDPGAGTNTRLDATVTLVISSGPAPVDVPFVIGMHRDEAISTLEAAGFLVAEEPFELEPGSGEVSLVIDQDPADGTAPTGSTVTIFVGSEPDVPIGE